MSSKKAIKKRNIKRECWQLDYHFYKWLKERLPVYLKDARRVVDLTYHKQVYKGVEMTQEEAIKRMIRLIDLMECCSDWSDEHEEYRKELMDLWSMWLPYIWW